jgi:hypothetical protein
MKLEIISAAFSALEKRAGYPPAGKRYTEAWESIRPFFYILPPAYEIADAFPL